MKKEELSRESEFVLVSCGKYDKIYQLQLDKSVHGQTGKAGRQIGIAFAGLIRRKGIDMAIPKDIEGDFFSGVRGDAVKFCYNDSVTVTAGDYAGKSGSIVLLIDMEPQVTYMISLSDGSADIEITQDALSLAG